MISPIKYGTWRPFGVYAMPWSALQPTKGSYTGSGSDQANMLFNWSVSDILMQEASLNGIKVMWPAIAGDQVGGTVVSGPWGIPAEGAVPQKPQYIKDFVTALLSRYPNQINRIEQRNEPFPATNGWTGTMQQLVTEGAAIYQAVKATNLPVKVLSPPFYSSPFFRQWLNTIDPVTGLMGHQTCDELALHTYAAAPNKAISGIDLWSSTSIGPGEAYRHMDDLGIARKPYSVTEWGISESLGTETDAFAALNPAARKTYISRVLAMAALNGAQAFTIFGYNILAGDYVLDTDGVMAAVSDIHTKLSGKTIVAGGYLPDGSVRVVLSDGQTYTW